LSKYSKSISDIIKLEPALRKHEEGKKSDYDNKENENIPLEGMPETNDTIIPNFELLEMFFFFVFFLILLSKTSK
jgi:hypothetical protein